MFFRIFLNNLKKKKKKKANKEKKKIGVKMWQNIFKIHFSGFIETIKRKHENIATKIFPFYFDFSHFGKILHHEFYIFLWVAP
jgi:tRNA(Glu) U13 pseudouridine synthase TruD